MLYTQHIPSICTYLDISSLKSMALHIEWVTTGAHNPCKIHFNPGDEQTKSGNFTTKIRKFFSFHCVRAASNPFRLVLDTVTPSTAVHSSPRPLYPSSFKCARACTPEQSRYLPGGPGCAHGTKSCPTGVQL